MRCNRLWVGAYAVLVTPAWLGVRRRCTNNAQAPGQHVAGSGALQAPGHARTGTGRRPRPGWYEAGWTEVLSAHHVALVDGDGAHHIPDADVLRQSMPSVTCRTKVVRLGELGGAVVVQMKNWRPLVSGPALLAIATAPSVYSPTLNRFVLEPVAGYRPARCPRAAALDHELGDHCGETSARRVALAGGRGDELLTDFGASCGSSSMTIGPRAVSIVTRYSLVASIWFSGGAVISRHAQAWWSGVVVGGRSGGTFETWARSWRA